MISYLETLQLEKKRLKGQIEKARKFLANAPKGSLSIRKRKHTYSYYCNIDSSKYPNRTCRQINITKNKQLIIELTEKRIQERVLKHAQQNLHYLEKYINHYMSSEIADIVSGLHPQYVEVLTMRKNRHIQNLQKKDYPKAKFNPKSHIHETDCGELVRSKSEQIILNTLNTYPLIVHYEEEFIYRTGVPGINRIYPDFTIILPDGSRILWEHLGRLDDPVYCQRAAAKLNLYQKNGLVIGKNLIITMDDHNGNISSALVQDAIQHYILPKMEKVW